eukprot:CAMPEP_0116115544 /NCGR_PEP_ID=MMETSP0329-20121206/561_1 /TAXON_ID=697910 /ORGANISM="Pseudo-nitzschia arenysensis, Strain B593" /LENGTH=1296 /DNA_ID=CAMNT_0003608979 /DNA_START=106 /DNA_END=3996 /DNA_ORIENTATION=+
MHSTTSFTEVSYHSSDDEIEETSETEDEEGMVFEEVTEIEEEDGDSFNEEQEDEAENASGPVKSNAPIPLHQLLANKLKNTNVKLVEPGMSKPRSVKEMAAAFSPPRPASFTRKPPIETGRFKEAPKWPNDERNSPEQDSKQKSAPPTIASLAAKRQPPPPEKFIPKKRATLNIKGKPMKKPTMRKKPSSSREVDRMEKLSEGSHDESSNSDQSPSVGSFSSQRQSSSSDEVSISEVQEFSERQNDNEIFRQPNATGGIIIPQQKLDKKSNMKRPYDGTVDDSSSSNSSSSSSYSFSVSSGTDESLAAKLGDLGTPFAPLPIAANFIPEDTNHDTSGSSSSDTPEGNRSQDPDEAPTREGTFGLERQVSWSDLLGEGGKDEKFPLTGSFSDGERQTGGEAVDGDGDGDNDGSDSDSYESYETASSEEEFETDTERDQSKSVGPPGVSVDELIGDQESSETSDYETDTSYERKYAESEGRTPPPPKKPTPPPFNSPSGRLNYSPMPIVNENEINEEWPDQNALNVGNHEDQRRRERGRRRKPYEDIPTAVAAELRQISKNDPATSGDGTTPLGIAGWDGQDESNDQGNGNCFDRIFKKKGSNDVNDQGDLEPTPLPESPNPYDPPDYDNDDDEISNITDRVFSPKTPTPEQPASERPLEVVQENSVSRSSSDTSGRFSITRFRKSNSVRNTERALEGLKATSIEPNIVSRSKKEKRNIPALLNMQNEAVDFYVPRDHDSLTPSTGDFHTSSSRAFDSRDVIQRMEYEPYDDYDPTRTEIVEERFVGYDDGDEDYATHSRFDFNDEEHAQERALNPNHGGNKKDTARIVRTDEKPTMRKSKRLGMITCIVICNLLLLLCVGAWLLVEYFLLQDGRGSSFRPGRGKPALPPSSKDIKDDLRAILQPNLPDGGASFNDETSPQSEALDWMINDPQIRTYDEEKLSVRFVLATFYFATDGDNWTTNHLWLTDLDECLWYTSSIDSPCTEGQFSRLILTDNNLQGTLPKELSVLSNSLVSLDVDGTFTGEIPSNIGDLTKLTTLRLSGRVISGKIPPSLYTLSDLSTLDLGQNLLSGELSSAIGNLSSLKSFSLMGNHFTGWVPKDIGQLTGLTHFNIDDNYFNIISHEGIGRLTKLETLSMRNNALKGILPLSIGYSLTNLKGLFLNNNEFTGSIPDSYGNLSRLENGLDLSSNSLTGSVPDSLGQLSMLKNLLIRDNALTGTVPLSLGKLSILNTLRLDSTYLEGELPTALCDSFNEAYSSYYVDCWKLDCPCCNFCCDGLTGECICRFADSLPILCVEP